MTKFIRKTYKNKTLTETGLLTLAVKTVMSISWFSNKLTKGWGK